MRKKVILYGAADCASCVKTKSLLDEAGIRYGYVDILAGLAHLKKFLSIRDSHPELYGEVLGPGMIGIPTIVVNNGEIYLEGDGWELDKPK